MKCQILIFCFTIISTLVQCNVQGQQQNLIPTRDNELTGRPKSDSAFNERVNTGRSLKLAPDFRGEFGGFESIILTDDREVVENTTLYPFTAVVHINFTCPSIQPLRSLCSGTMIGARTVLTAAHCIWTYKYGGVENGEECFDFIVIPGKQGDVEPFGKINATKAVVPQQWKAAAASPLNYSNSDYALLILNEDIGLQTGWLSYSLDCFQTSYPDMIVAGYPGDEKFGGTVMTASTCNVELNACQNNVSDGEFFHQCDTFGGQSGSAMWVVEENGNRVIRGVHSAGTSNKESGFNRAVYISFDAFYWIEANKEKQ